jgi:hypothetical protein
LALTVLAGVISFLCLDADVTTQWVVCAAFCLLLVGIAVRVGGGLPELVKDSVLAIDSTPAFPSEEANR